MNDLITLTVTTHSGDVDEVEVAEYDAFTLAQDLNDNDIHAIALGDNVYARIDIKGVKPVKNGQPEENKDKEIEEEIQEAPE